VFHFNVHLDSLYTDHWSFAVKIAKFGDYLILYIVFIERQWRDYLILDYEKYTSHYKLG
jgi:hypothetical protein